MIHELSQSNLDDGKAFVRTVTEQILFDSTWVHFKYGGGVGIPTINTIKQTTLTQKISKSLTLQSRKTIKMDELTSDHKNRFSLQKSIAILRQ